MNTRILTLRSCWIVLCLIVSFFVKAGTGPLPTAAPPPPSISPSGPVTFCGNGVLTVGGFTGNPSFSWLLNNSPIAGANQLTYTVTTSGNYSCVLIYSSTRDTTPVVAATVLPANSVTVTASDANICNGSNTVLTASATIAGSTFAWSPATGLSAVTGTNVTATPTTTTQYQVIGTAPNGCRDTARVTITVNVKPNASFTYHPNSGCPRRRRVIAFNSTSTPSAGMTYAWNFGDPSSGSNNTATNSNPQHSFVGAGFGTPQSFTVTLIVTTPAGCKDTVTQNIPIGAFPDATLEGNPPLSTYNGQPYFFQCDTSQHTFTFYNQTSTASINTNYIINWGDGSPNYTNPSWGTGAANGITHYYNIGTYQITYYVFTGTCVDTSVYNIFIGSNPGGSISSPSSTQGCTGTTFSFPFANIASNAPGTDYYIYVNDGSDTVHYTQETLPATFIHTFDSTSCGIAPNNTFTISYNIVNPCGETPGTIGGIRISKKAEADFTISPNDTTCVNNIITLTNTSTVGSTVPNSGSGSCTSGKTIWTITPAAGWTVNSGSLGNNNGQPNNPDSWTSGTDIVQVAFTTAGIYTIRIITGTNRCGMDTMTRTICVNPEPTASFTLNTLTGCAPLSNVTAAATTNAATCGQNVFRWTVTYAPTAGCLPDTENYTYTSGTSATSQNPVFNFINPGIYTVSLQTIAPLAACSSAVVSQQVIVKGRPVVSISGVPANVCQGQSVSPTNSSTCYIDAATTYSWTFTNGTPASSNTSTPGTITYNTNGSQTIALAVTNSCGVTNATANFTVSALPTITGTSTICINNTTTLTGSGTPATVSPWVSSNPGVATVNSTGVVTGISAGTAIITYTNSNGCTRTITITVLAIPQITGTTAICVGNTTTLTATGTPGATPWTSSNPSVATVSSTGVVTGVSAGTSTITFTNSAGCDNSVLVTISGAPVISGANNGCIGNSFSLTGSGTPATTNPWVSSAPGIATINSSGTVTGVSAGTATITYTTNVGCVNTVNITINPTPTITGPTSVCAGNTITLTGSGTPATTNPWVSSNVSVATVSNSGVVTGVSGGTVTITYTSNNGCPATQNITIRPLPVISGGAGLCVGATLSLAGTGSPATTSPWVSSNPAIATISNSGVVTGIATGTTVITYTDINGCASTQSVAVNPIPAITGVKNDPAGCSSTTGSIVISGLTNGGAYTLNYNYNTAPQPAISFTATGTSYTMAALPSGNYTNITVSILGCVSNALSFTLVDPNPPTAPTTSAGPVICSGNNFTISVTSPVAGTTYNWSGPGGYSNTGTSITITSATVANGGNYQVTATVSGCTSPATSVTAVVNQTPAAPIVSSPVSLCQNATATALTATALANHTLQWYTVATGGTASTTAPTPVTTTPGTTTYYVSQLSADNCEGPRAAIQVVVNPVAFISPINDTICSSATFSVVPTATIVPAGTVYSWAAPVVTGGLTGGAAGTNATSITGTISNPTDFVQTATYTVQPITNGCAGANFTLTIYVNPAPRVNFAPGNQTICSGQSTVAVALSSATPGVGLPWTAVQPAGITGVVTSGTGTIPVQTLVNNTTAAITVTYAAVAVTSGSSACPGDTSRYSITVNPKPLVPAQTAAVCSRDSIRFAPANNPPASIVPPGTAYTWTFTDNPNVTGESSQAVAQDSIRQLLVNTTNIPQPVIYTVTPTSGAAGSCVGNPFQLTITVQPTPEIPVLTDTICSGEQFIVTPQHGIPTVATIIPAGTSYSWSAPVMPPGTGGAAAGINQPNISGTLTNTTLSAVTITYLVTPVSGASGNCTGTPFQVNVYVKPRASVSNNPLNQSVCNGLSTTAINWTSLSPGASYSWTLVSSGAVTGFLPNGSGPTLGSMVLANTGIAQDSVVYAVTSTASACAGAPTNYTIYVNPDAKASFTQSADTACWPFAINISNTSPQSPGNVNIPNGSYQWYAVNTAGVSTALGAGTSFPGYTIPGPSESITIKMVAISAFGCKNDSASHTFYTKPQPQALFATTTQDSCGPLVVAFTNQTNLIDTFQYNWDFGNGQTSTLANPAPVTFLSSPSFTDTTYYITLSAFNECDTTTYVDSVIIRANPKARFFVSSTSGCSPFTIQITNTSLGNGFAYYWDFGNGDTDTTFTTGTFSYTYFTSVVDTFQLTLIAENQCGRDTQVINIRVAPNIIQPGVTINSTELFGCASHTVNFINSTSGATQFTWDFGDGSAPQTTGVNEIIVPHTYTTAGVFTVTVQMTNGCSDTSIQKQVTVYAKPVAAFNTNNTVYCLGDTTRVINTSSNATNYIWSWGAGPNTSGFEPPHVYTAPGTYTILLRAERTNAGGVVCFDTTSRSVTVLSKPDSTIITNIQSANCAPFTFQASAPGITTETVTWYVYDTTQPSYPIIFNGQTLSYTFNNQGTFEVEMIAENAAGCKDSSRRVFFVYGKPVAAFSPLNISTCSLDTTVSYINNSTASAFTPLSYRWLVDGALQATTGNFTYNYVTLSTGTLPRIFETKLVARNSVGCTDTATGTLQMNPTSKAIFTVGNTNACIPFDAAITNSSTYATQFAWYLNGTLVSSDPNPVITITQPNTAYTIRLITSNGYACRPDTSDVSFTSRVMPKAIFTINNALGCTGTLNVVTANNSTNANTYSWNWGDATPVSTSFNPTHLYTTLGTYQILLTVSDGTCTDTTSRYVIVGQKPIVDFEADNQRTCDTAFVHFTNLTSFGDSYQWVFSNGIRTTDPSPTIAFPPSNTPYTVQLIATNTIGCKDSLTKPNYIRSIVPPKADFQINPSPVISIPNYTFSFINLTSNNPLYKYQWDLADGATASTRDVLSHLYADTGSYPVRLIVIDTATRCLDTITKIARIQGYPGYLFVPNAFYPNSLQNQFRTFKPLGKGLAEYELQIFDSWGKLLFKTNKLDAAGVPVEGWDGTFKGQPMPQDAYAWKINAVFRNGIKWAGMNYNQNVAGTPGHTFGTVTLFR